MDMPGGVAEGDLPRPERLPIDEGHPARPTNPYGVSKLLTERMLDELCSGREGLLGNEMSAGRLSAVSLRLPYLMTADAFERARGRELRPGYRWGGVEGFAYLHVEDAAALAVSALEREISGHEVVWACAPDPRHSGGVEAVVREHYGGVAGAEEAVRRGSLHDCSKAGRLLGFAPRRLLSNAWSASGVDGG
jgi:nucleoside-diphosphate-sugar epimerase